MNNDKILLVDDDIALRQLYTFILQKEGYNVLTAADGEEGLTLAQNNTDAKLMLLDIMMPKMHGIEVLKKMKENPATQKITVILLTNLSEESVVEEAMKIGAYKYLVKAFLTPQQIIDTVKEFLASPPPSQ